MKEIIKVTKRIFNLVDILKIEDYFCIGIKTLLFIDED